MPALKLLKENLLRFACILVLAGLSGCYGEMQVTKQFASGSSYNRDSTQVVFYTFFRAFRPSRGLPETPITRYRNTSLYLYDLNSEQLKRVMDFGKLRFTWSRYNTDSHFLGDSIAFRLMPVSGWESEIAWGMDSTFAELHRQWYLAGPNGIVVSRADSVNIENAAGHPCSLGELYEITGGIPFLEWRADIEHIFPKRRRKRIKRIVELYGNQLYRDALIEYTVPDLSERRVRRIIDNIGKRYDRLDPAAQVRARESKELTINKLIHTADLQI